MTQNIRICLVFQLITQQRLSILFIFYLHNHYSVHYNKINILLTFKQADKCSLKQDHKKRKNPRFFYLHISILIILRFPASSVSPLPPRPYSVMASGRRMSKKFCQDLTRQHCMEMLLESERRYVYIFHFIQLSSQRPPPSFFPLQHLTFWRFLFLPFLNL